MRELYGLNDTLSMVNAIVLSSELIKSVTTVEIAVACNAEADMRKDLLYASRPLLFKP